MTTPRLSLQGITKRFGSTPVLNGIDLEIADGEFLTLVGPSGCGKSTTLRIIAGLEAQTTGDLRIDGTVVNHVRPSRRDLAMVFQSYALYPHLTVHQNLATPLLLRDLGTLERMPLFGALVEWVGFGAMFGAAGVSVALGAGIFFAGDRAVEGRA